MKQLDKLEEGQNNLKHMIDDRDQELRLENMYCFRTRNEGGKKLLMWIFKGKIHIKTSSHLRFAS